MNKLVIWLNSFSIQSEWVFMRILSLLPTKWHSTQLKSTNKYFSLLFPTGSLEHFPEMSSSLKSEQTYSIENVQSFWASIWKLNFRCIVHKRSTHTIIDTYTFCVYVCVCVCWHLLEEMKLSLEKTKGISRTFFLPDTNVALHSESDCKRFFRKQNEQKHLKWLTTWMGIFSGQMTHSSKLTYSKWKSTSIERTCKYPVQLYSNISFAEHLSTSVFHAVLEFFWNYHCLTLCVLVFDMRVNGHL